MNKKINKKYNNWILMIGLLNLIIGMNQKLMAVEAKHDGGSMEIVDEINSFDNFSQIIIPKIKSEISDYSDFYTDYKRFHYDITNARFWKQEILKHQTINHSDTQSSEQLMNNFDEFLNNMSDKILAIIAENDPRKTEDIGFIAEIFFKKDMNYLLKDPLTNSIAHHFGYYLRAISYVDLINQLKESEFLRKILGLSILNYHLNEKIIQKRSIDPYTIDSDEYLNRLFGIDINILKQIKKDLEGDYSKQFKKEVAEEFEVPDIQQLRKMHQRFTEYFQQKNQEEIQWDLDLKTTYQQKVSSFFLYDDYNFKLHKKLMDIHKKILQDVKQKDKNLLEEIEKDLKIAYQPEEKVLSCLNWDESVTNLKDNIQFLQTAYYEVSKYKIIDNIFGFGKILKNKKNNLKEGQEGFYSTDSSYLDSALISIAYGIHALRKYKAYNAWLNTWNRVKNNNNTNAKRIISVFMSFRNIKETIEMYSKDDKTSRNLQIFMDNYCKNPSTRQLLDEYRQLEQQEDIINVSNTPHVLWLATFFENDFNGKKSSDFNWNKICETIQQIDSQALNNIFDPIKNQLEINQRIFEQERRQRLIVMQETGLSHVQYDQMVRSGLIETYNETIRFPLIEAEQRLIREIPIPYLLIRDENLDLSRLNISEQEYQGRLFFSFTKLKSFIEQHKKEQDKLIQDMDKFKSPALQRNQNNKDRINQTNIQEIFQQNKQQIEQMKQIKSNIKANASTKKSIQKLEQEILDIIQQNKEILQGIIDSHNLKKD
jgi:L-lactate utilization protein LutC